MSLQAVVLVRGVSKELQPLLSEEMPKAFLPIANRPLLEHTLELLEGNGLKSLILVVADEKYATKIGAWLSETFEGRFHLEVVRTAADAGTADALRSVMDRIHAEDLLVVPGDLVGTVSLGALVAVHRREQADATVLFCQPTLPTGAGAAEERPKDKKPSFPDVIGLDASGQRLLFLASGTDVQQHLNMPRRLTRTTGQVTLRTNLTDPHLYIFNSQTIKAVLQSQPKLSSIKRHVLPYLIQSERASTWTEVEDNFGFDEPGRPTHASNSMGEPSPTSDSVPPAQGGPVRNALHKCCAVIADPRWYCARVQTKQVYLDINRDVVSDNSLACIIPTDLIHPAVKLGAKFAMGPQGLIGEGTCFGDKCSVKKSVIGRHCQIGNNVKVTNSVVMDYATLGDGALVQNSVICIAAKLEDRASIKDCFVATGAVVPGDKELKGTDVLK